MDSVFIKVNVNEKLPEFGQRVIALVVEQNDLGQSKFLWNVCYHDDTKTFTMDNQGEVQVEYWLEEIEIPDVNHMKYSDTDTDKYSEHRHYIYVYDEGYADGANDGYKKSVKLYTRFVWDYIVVFQPKKMSLNKKALS